MRGGRGSSSQRLCRGACLGGRTPDGLHVNALASMPPPAACSGGIQIAWPQYGVGPLPTNGFLQNLHWSVVETAWREPEAAAAGAEQAAGGEPGAAGSTAAAAGTESLIDWRPTISLYTDTGASRRGAVGEPQGAACPIAVCCPIARGLLAACRVVWWWWWCAATLLPCPTCMLNVPSPCRPSP